MRFKYKIQHIFNNSLSDKEMKDIVCKKIARLIIIEERTKNLF